MCQAETKTRHYTDIIDSRTANSTCNPTEAFALNIRLRIPGKWSNNDPTMKFRPVPLKELEPERTIRLRGNSR